MDALRAHFRPEFINRVDEIIIFHPLTRDQMKSIIDIQVRNLLKRLDDRKIYVTLTETAKDWLVQRRLRPGLRRAAVETRDSEAGARSARHPGARRRVRRRRSHPGGCRQGRPEVHEAAQRGRRVMPPMPGAPRPPRPAAPRAPAPPPARSLWLLTPRFWRSRPPAFSLCPRRPPEAPYRVRELDEGRQDCRSDRRRGLDSGHAEGARRQQQTGSLHHGQNRGSGARLRARPGEGEIYGRAHQPVDDGRLQLPPSALAAPRVVEPALPPDGRRGRRRDVVRPEPRENLFRRRREGELRRRRRRRRSEGRAQGNRRVPAEPQEVHQPWRPDSQGRAAGGSARNRQDAAGARRGRRGPRAVLQPERIGVRRDVRRRGRRPGARPVCAGRSQGAVHRVHRRARRPRQDARAERDGRARRTRADVEPAAGGDGRLRFAQGRHHHGRHQPAGGAGSGADAAGPLRSPGARRQAGRAGGARPSCVFTPER